MTFEARIEGLGATQNLLQGFSARRLNAALATALTRTAREIEGEWRGDIFAHIDRPTRFTLNAVVVRPATAAAVQAEVLIRDQAARPGAPAPVDWMAPNEVGGPRYVKKFERALIAQGALPAGMKVVPGPYAQLDEFGNISRAQITAVIAQLGTQFSPGYARTISPRLSKRLASARRHGREYVALTQARGKLKPGVYQRQGHDLLLVFAYVSRVTYRQVTHFGAEGLKVGTAQAALQVERALGEHIARLQAAGRAL